MKSASLQYANALADIALEQGAAEPSAKQLENFGEAYAQSAELRTFLASPAISVEAKHGVLEKILKRLGASKIIRNFLFVIADHRRTNLIPEIIDTFQQVIRQRQGVAEAAVSSVIE
ncbi:MAG TPA: ATP synthase F1 subunit delta, partial [Candidatus Acidoferrum sp.]